jgi:glucokinase
MAEVAVGLDIGGTNTVIGLVDQSGSCLAAGALKTGQHAEVKGFVNAVADEIERLLVVSQADLVGIGIGAPNANYFAGTIEDAPNLRWKGVLPLADLFKRHFPQQRIVVTNDANAAAIGEMLFGAAQGMKDFIVITLGTGVGSGIVVNGELLYGHDGFAGEIGHTIAVLDGRQCGCGRRGCLETYASAGGICRTVFELLATSNEPSELRGISFQDLTAVKVTAAAQRGDRIALDTFVYTGKILGLKLADAIAHTSPEAIFLFGGPTKAGRLIFAPTEKYMNEFVLHLFRGKVKLLPSGLADENVAALGAAALIWQGQQ